MVNASREGTYDWRVVFRWATDGSPEACDQTLIVFGIANEAVALEEARLSLAIAERLFTITTITKTTLPFLMPLWMTRDDNEPSDLTLSGSPSAMPISSTTKSANLLPKVLDLIRPH
nr:hypothetical protein [uncultured Lichenicoccus sp.]